MCSMLIDVTSIALALLLAVAAAITDIRTMRIPNLLTIPAILLGLALLMIRCADGYPPVLAGILALLSYAYVYLIWRCSMWGGGDAKAVLSMFILVTPVFGSLYFMAAFSLCLAFTLLFRQFFYGTMAALLSLKLKPAAISIIPMLCPVLLYLALSPFGMVYAAVFSLVSMAVLADLASDSLPYYETLSIKDGSMDAIGKKPAEDIWLEGAMVIRRLRPAGFIRSLCSYGPKAHPVMGDTIYGLSGPDIELLRRHVPDIRVMLQKPMGPALLIAFLASMMIMSYLSCTGALR